MKGGDKAVKQNGDEGGVVDLQSEGERRRLKKFNSGRGRGKRQGVAIVSLKCH
jgi:hypothetical protein